MAAGYASELGITNIRILQRLSRTIDEFAPSVATARLAVQASLAHAAALLVWSYYGHAAGAPGYAFTKNVALTWFADVSDISELPENEAAWMGALSDYGYHPHHLLDAEVCRYLEQGYIDDTALTAAVHDANAQAAKEAASGSMKDAWGLLHHTFADNTSEFVQRLVATSRGSARWLPFAEAEYVCVVLRKLGKGIEANDFACHWVLVNAAIDRNRLIAPENFLGPREEDAMFQAETKRVAGAPIRPTLADTIRDRVGRNGWNPIDIEVLSTATVDEYVAFFDSAGPDEELGRLIHACLRFGRINPPEADYRKIATTASDALRVLSARSAINALRVKTFPLYPASSPTAPAPAKPSVPQE